MTTLLVTGGAGFIGSNFIRYWLEYHNADRVINLDLLTYAGNLNSLRDVEKTAGDRYVFAQGDIGNYHLVRHLIDTHTPDYIVNFAAESHNSRAVLDPGSFFRTNVIGTQTLLQAAMDAGVPRFHHISTCEVYGDLSLESRESFVETSPYRPRTPYNASKAAADLAVRVYHDTFGLPITISNCANNYGPFQFPEKVIPLFTIRALSGQKMPLYKSSKNRREWLHVLDHCRAVEMVLADGVIGETYNVGSGVEIDVEGIADLIIDELGLTEAIKTYVDDRPGHDRRYLLNSKKIENDLGWTPKHSVSDGIRETIEWYRDNEAWWRPLVAAMSVDESAW